MQIVFRPLPAGGPPPAPGEVLVRPQRSEHQQRRDLACLVLEHGLEALPRGSGPVSHVVVSDDPTFDDLLAATFVQRLLSGQSLPDGCKAFARYAAVVRQGLRPGAIPLHVSMEGIFLALRNAVGRPQESLTDSAAAARFVEEWSRMATRILAAAADGLDPFTNSLFETGADFALERAFLAEDRKAYEQDVRRGERWRVRIPREAPPVAGLLLRRPASLLFKHWAREDQEAPARKGYQFLAVDWGAGQWVFSTDPVQRLSLEPLAERLQESEAARDAGRAAADPWFDGKPFNHTLVAAPKQGTVLSDREVLRVVHRELRIVIIIDLRALVAVAALVAGLLVAGAVFRWWPTTPQTTERQPPPFELSARIDNDPVPEERMSLSKEDGISSVEMNVNLRKGDTSVVFRLPRRVSQHVKLRLRLKSEAGVSAKSTVTVNKDKPQLLIKPDGSAAVLANEFESDDLPAFFDVGEDANIIVVELGNLSGEAQAVSLRLSWRTNLEVQRNLYLVAMGVSQYQFGLVAPTYAGADAKDLVAAFRAQEGRLFAKVHVHGDEALCGEMANKDELISGLKWLRAHADSQSLAVFTFSGHGIKDDASGQFFFLTKEYKNASQPESCSVGWSACEPILQGMPCPVLVVIDACQSGASSPPRVKAQSVAELEKAFDRALSKLSRTNNGIMILAACGSEERAREAEGHGALTMAVLEAITGERLPKNKPFKGPALLPQENGRAVITQQDVKDYVTLRMKELMGDKQTVAAPFTEGMDLRDIALAKAK
jgi:hypothetical protein